MSTKITDTAMTSDAAPLPGAAYADESAAVLDTAGDIGAHLALWSMRDDSRPCAAARRAANDAMDAIDTALRELHALRARLVGDIRDSDDAAIARVDAMLAAAAEPDSATADASTGSASDASAAAAGDASRSTAVPLELAAGLAAVTADENGEHPGDVEAAAGSLPWTMADDGSHWRAVLPDGRTGVIRRVVGEDGESSLLFVATVYESALDFVTGPECAGVLAAAAWAAEFAAASR
ncbi:MAG: hypothetical protein ACRDN0_34665 [Trebonia sp.]